MQKEQKKRTRVTHGRVSPPTLHTRIALATRNPAKSAATPPLPTRSSPTPVLEEATFYHLNSLPRFLQDSLPLLDGVVFISTLIPYDGSATRSPSTFRRRICHRRCCWGTRRLLHRKAYEDRQQQAVRRHSVRAPSPADSFRHSDTERAQPSPYVHAESEDSVRLFLFF